MNMLPKLQKVMKVLEQESQHAVCWHSIYETLTILLCGLLCHQKTISEIHEWTESSPVRSFSADEGITRIPCRAQFYNILGCINSERFNYYFTQWVQCLLPETLSGKTIAIDGKTVC